MHSDLHIALLYAIMLAYGKATFLVKVDRTRLARTLGDLTVWGPPGRKNYSRPVSSSGRIL